MSSRVDVLIVGAGPAGMAAAVTARRHGLDVLVVDEQPAPGGQIWRRVEDVARTSRAAALGAEYLAGLEAVTVFRASGAVYSPSTSVWQVEAGPRAFMTRGGAASMVEAGALVLATGALERPAPFPGWTLPGVMTVGAAQILLKTAFQIPDQPVWIAGHGPLALLYAVQLLRAGGRIAGFLDTAAPGGRWAALPHLAAALAAPGELAKGVGWMRALGRAGVPVIRGVAQLSASGDGRLERLEYVSGGQRKSVPASVLLVHEGLVPGIHPTLLLGCTHGWNAAQGSFAPRIDAWGESSAERVFVAGDMAGIGGAAAAALRGEIAGIGVAVRLGRLSPDAAEALAGQLRIRLKRALATRPLLDALYRPRPAALVPPGPTLACRCENISADAIRAQAEGGRPGPNQVKAYTRAGMGPCQGRQCAYTVANILADAEGRAVPDIGLFRVRPPLKPLTLGELAALDETGSAPR